MEWIPVCSTTNDLSWVEEESALALCNIVPHSPCAQSERLNRFRQDRVRDDTEEEEDAKEQAPPPEGPHEEGAEEEDKYAGDINKDYNDEDYNCEDDNDEDDNDGDSSKEDSSSDDARSLQQSPHSGQSFCEKCHHPCPTSWAQECKTEYEESEGEPLQSLPSSHPEGNMSQLRELMEVEHSDKLRDKMEQMATKVDRLDG